MQNATRARSAKPKGKRGFTLVELLVAMAIFLLITKAAFELFQKQQVSSEVVQGQVGLNMALRNAATMLQVDLANAGTNFYRATTLSSPGWAIGVSIVNNAPASGTSCYTASSNTYGSTCFDQLNIISAADPGVYPAINATDTSGGSSPTLNCSTSSNGTAYGQAAPANSFFPSGLSLSATAALFKQGDQILFMDSSGSFMTTAVLTQNAAVDSGGKSVKFIFHATNSDGSNTYNPPSQIYDPLHITDCMGTTPCNPGGRLGQTQFCGNDWIIKLAPAITYQVDTTTDPTNPTLTRTVTGGSALTVMEQVIGFKVGAAIYQAADGQPNYNYVASSYSSDSEAFNDAYNFTLVRAVRISLLGRSIPNTDPNYKFRNGFDNGPYQVQGTAVVVNPRDLSMNDN